MRVVVSNGTNRFQLAPLAASLQQAGLLVGFFVAGWPIGWQRRLAQRFNRYPSAQRFLDRREAIDDRLVYSQPIAELLSQAAALARKRSEKLAEKFDVAAQQLYAWRAGQPLPRLRPEIYHFRSCFGHASVKVAKRLGAITLCDHSIAHPRVLSHLVSHEGQMPPLGGVAPASELEERMQSDLAQADHVLVNSDFVRTTCLHAGMHPDRVHVVYWGVDDKFVESIPLFGFDQVRARQGQSVLYAGTWQARKGVHILAKALSGGGAGDLPELEFAGAEDVRFVRAAGHGDFLGSRKVRRLGNISRAELAGAMTRHRIFVFPSLCEGSARVIFEAMACGCFIITTPNSGSIVQDGIHGRLVPPGDAGTLRIALGWAQRHPEAVADIGWRNAALVRKEYTQQAYGQNVISLYKNLTART